MKKVVYLLLITMLVSFGSFGKKTMKKAKTKPKTNQAMICFGWHTIYSKTTGQAIGKYSDNCWNSSQGHHSTTILYVY